MEGLGEVAALDEIGEALEEFAHVDGGAVEVEESLGKDGDGDDAAGQNGPHEQATLLDVIDHGKKCLAAFGGQGKWRAICLEIHYFVVGTPRCGGMCIAKSSDLKPTSDKETPNCIRW